jgi:hypothetical protein
MCMFSHVDTVLSTNPLAHVIQSMSQTSIWDAHAFSLCPCLSNIASRSITISTLIPILSAATSSSVINFHPSLQPLHAASAFCACLGELSELVDTVPGALTFFTPTSNNVHILLFASFSFAHCAFIQGFFPGAK